MATPNEQLSAALRTLEEKIDQLCLNAEDLTMQASALRVMRNRAAEAVSTDQPFSSVVKSLRDLSAAVGTYSSVHAKAADSLSKVIDHEQRLREVANG